mmetsp:Transcript_38601/g.89315  ORF Transcript_38601/g.89315 Transcript_38601/m.89315 type:complete len:297 (-) Transcript_38601:864-1754(-)
MNTRADGKAEEIPAAAALWQSGSLVVEHTKQGHSAPDPVALVLFVTGQPEIADKVRGVACCRKRALSQGRLVDRAGVPSTLRGDGLENCLFHDLDPNNRQLLEKHSLLRFHHLLARHIPSSALEEQAVDVHAISRRIGKPVLSAGGRLLPEDQIVDGDLGLAGMDLLGAGHESLWEVKAWYPEARWGPQLQPAGHELDALLEVGEPGVQRLQARIRHLTPQRRQLLGQEAVVHLLQLRRHHHEAFDGLPQCHQCALNPVDENVEAIHLLAMENPKRDDAAIRCFLVRLGMCFLPPH